SPSPLRANGWGHQSTTFARRGLGERAERSGPARTSRGGFGAGQLPFVSPNYWQAMGVRLKHGRFLEESDRNRPKAVISERAAQYLWPNQDPLGKRVRGAGPQPPSLEVVGVVGEVRAGGLDQAPPMM